MCYVVTETHNIGNLYIFGLKTPKSQHKFKFLIERNWHNRAITWYLVCSTQNFYIPNWFMELILKNIAVNQFNFWSQNAFPLERIITCIFWFFHKIKCETKCYTKTYSNSHSYLYIFVDIRIFNNMISVLLLTVVKLIHKTWHLRY